VIILTLLEDPRIFPYQIPLTLKVYQIQTAITRILKKPSFFLRSPLALKVYQIQIAITQILKKPSFFLSRVQEEDLEVLLQVEVLQVLEITAVPQALELYILS